MSEQLPRAPEIRGHRRWYSARAMSSLAYVRSLLLVAASLSLSCGGERAAPPPKAAPRAAKTQARASADAPTRTGSPQISADAAVHDFGPIKATDTVEHVFTIRNTGGADLKIERVQKT